jgi:hypothetical protein
VQLLDCSGAGFAVTSETARPGRADVPPTGDCEITVPFDLLDLEAGIRERPLRVRERLADDVRDLRERLCNS